MEWLNWPGWHWVAILIAMATGFYMGWSIRSTNARSAEALGASCRRLVEQLARCSDIDEDAPDIDDCVETLAKAIRGAKSIVGDLSEVEKP